MAAMYKGWSAVLPVKADVAKGMPSGSRTAAAIFH